jgi:hypothetical protein
MHHFQQARAVMFEMSRIQLCLIADQSDNSQFVIYIDSIIVNHRRSAKSIQLRPCGTAGSRHGALFTCVGFGDAFSLVWEVERTMVSSTPPMIYCMTGLIQSESSMSLSIRMYWLGETWPGKSEEFLFFALAVEHRPFEACARIVRRTWIIC